MLFGIEFEPKQLNQEARDTRFNASVASLSKRLLRSRRRKGCRSASG